MKKLDQARSEELLTILQTRFEKNQNRHKGIKRAEVQKRLEANSVKLWSLDQMEETAGEPDVIGYDQQADAYIFCDCAQESPKGRRSLCYDTEALESRKEHKPKKVLWLWPKKWA